MKLHSKDNKMKTEGFHLDLFHEKDFCKYNLFAKHTFL